MKEEEKEGVAVLVATLTLTMSLDEEACSFCKLPVDSPICVGPSPPAADK